MSSQKKTGKVGIIDVGGGLRDIYGAGVLDSCIDQGITVDYGIGVSAGIANLGSYAAGQRGRNYRFFHDYSTRKEYMSWKNFFHSGSYLNLDYIYGTLSNTDGEDPFDFEAMAQSPMELCAVSTNALSGRPIYFDKNDFMVNDYYVFKTSCNIPVFDRPYLVCGVPCYDGGAVDPLPYKKAWADGCDRLIVILTKPEDELLDPRLDAVGARLLHRKYPHLAVRVLHRSQKYNRQLRECRAFRDEHPDRMLILSPGDIFGMKTLTNDGEILDSLYQMGLEDGKKVRDFLEMEAAPQAVPAPMPESAPAPAAE